jgi:ABC-type polysaccharide/polyol phosphate export permease
VESLVTCKTHVKARVPAPWQAIAAYNPVTYILEGVRALVLGTWATPAIWQGFITAGALFLMMAPSLSLHFVAP